MSTFKVETCLGAEINVGYFDIEEILNTLGIKDIVHKNKRVKGLVKKHGSKERIVGVAMRQIALDALQPALDGSFMPYDSYFNENSIPATSRDRRYDAEERFLLMCCALSYGKSIRSLKKLYKDNLTTKDWRDKAQKGQSLFQYFRRLLDDNTREYILSYRARVEKELDSSTSKKKELSEGRSESGYIARLFRIK